MLKFLCNNTAVNPMKCNKTLKIFDPIVSYHIFCHFSSTPLSDLVSNVSQTNVAIFWDLNNKPPKSISVLDAAICVKKASFSFGVVRFMAAFGNQNTLRNVRRDSNCGLSFCGVCGRRFWSSERLVMHFRDVHEVEHGRRLKKVEFARGSRRVRLVGKFSMKMREYRNAVRGFLNVNVGNCVSDDLKKAGFWVEVVSDKLRDWVLNVMEMKQVECVVIVCDDSSFVNVLKELKLRGVKVVVIGDTQDGELKRVADAAFSWQEIISGKAKKEVVSVVRRWKDRDALKSLSWSYNPEIEETR